MKFIFALLVTTLCAVHLNAQNNKPVVTYDKKTDLVTDESGNALFRFVPQRNGSTKLMEYSVQTVGGEELFFISAGYYNDPAERRSSNPEGRVLYNIFNFFSQKSKAEIQGFIVKEKYAQLIVDNRLVSNGTLDADAVARFVELTGTRYADRKKVLDTPTQTIIIQNNTAAPPPRSGVNVNVTIPH